MAGAVSRMRRVEFIAAGQDGCRSARWTGKLVGNPSGVLRYVAAVSNHALTLTRVDFSIDYLIIFETAVRIFRPYTRYEYA